MINWVITCSNRSPLTAQPRDSLCHRRSFTDAAVCGPLRLAGLGLIALCAGWISVISLLSSDLFAFNAKLDSWLHLLRFATLLTAVAAVALACWNVRLAWTRHRDWSSRAWSIILSLSCLLILYTSISYKLTGISLDYQ
jgi:hypothetical protein